MDKPKLAVVGSGIAGLSAAWLLKQKYDVTLIEGHERAGMGIYTIDYDNNGEQTRIDVPLRIFCEGYYQNLLALYKEIGVEVQSSDHSGIFATLDGQTLFHYGHFYFGSFKLSLPKGRSFFKASAWRLAWQNHQFFRIAHQQLAQADLSNITFEQFLTEQKISSTYRDTILLPILAVTCTCDYRSILNYPADIVLGYLTCGIWQYGILNAKHGVDDIVPRLVQGINVQLGAKVTEIKAAETKAAGAEEHQGSITVTNENGLQQNFDYVVVASQAQQAAAMLNGFDGFKELLQQVEFESSNMVVHTDTSILPKARVKHSPVSYILPNEGERPEVSVDLSKAIEKYQHQESVFQTWNPLREFKEDSVLADIKFTRPIVSLESRAALTELKEKQFSSDNRLWFCGSFMADKIPLLDAAVDSSVMIAEHLAVDIPWKKPAANS